MKNEVRLCEPGHVRGVNRVGQYSQFTSTRNAVRNSLDPSGITQVALIFAQPRGATVKADGPLQLLSLDRRTFKRVMGPMEDILKRNMKTYKRIAASNI